VDVNLEGQDPLENQDTLLVGIKRSSFNLGLITKKGCFKALVHVAYACKMRKL
jgi:hypothetical protein